MDAPKTWVKFLPSAKFAYNTSFHSGIQATTFHAIYGRPPLSFPSYNKGIFKIDVVDQELQHRDELLK